MYKNRKNSFREGWINLRGKDKTAVKALICHNLAIKEAAFYQRMRGEVEHTPAERIAIEMVFEKFGVKKVWGG